MTKEEVLSKIKRHFSTCNVYESPTKTNSFRISNVVEFNHENGSFLDKLGLKYSLKRSGSTMTININ